MNDKMNKSFCLSFHSPLAKLVGIVALVLIVLFPVAVYLSNVKAVARDEKFIHDEFEKVGTYNRVDKKTADEETKYLLGYLRFGAGVIDTDFFNAREKDHLIEVRELFKGGNRLLNASLMAFVVSVAFLFVLGKRAQDLPTQELQFSIRSHVFDLKQFSVLMASVVMLGALLTNVMTLFLIFALFNFDASFSAFHVISFEQDTWLLNVGDNLIKLFPEEFWADAATRVVLLSLFYANALFVLGILLYRTQKQK